MSDLSVGQWLAVWALVSASVFTFVTIIEYLRSRRSQAQCPDEVPDWLVADIERHAWSPRQHCSACASDLDTHQPCTILRSIDRRAYEEPDHG